MSKKLHILFLCSWYPSRVLPTNGDFIKRHAEAISTLNDVSVLHIISDKTISHSTLVATKDNNVNTFIGYVRYTSNPLVKYIRFTRMYKKAIRQIASFDIIHLNVLFPFGILALHQKIFNKIPFIISEHWTGYQSIASKKVSTFHKFIAKKIIRRASIVAPVSKHLQLSMISLGFKGKYLPIPNVVDTKLFIPKAGNKNAFTIVHISSLKNNHKNISGMLNVAKKLENENSNFNWNFIGGSRNNFDNQISELDFKSTKINFINHVSQTELVTYLQEASVFVLFSNYENLPCVILEAFSCGIPVISTDVGGIKEYFPENFGYLIPVNDEVKLKKCIIEIKNNPAYNQKEMHQFAEDNFSKKVLAKRFTDIYFKCLNNDS